MIKTTDRFATAAEYIAAHGWALSEELARDLATILVRKAGVWRVRATPPKAPRARAIWHAYRDVRHASSWGYLPSAGAHSKVAFFMFEGRDQVEVYDHAFDAFLVLARTARRAAA